MVIRTWYESTPECASYHSLLQSRQVHVLSQATILEGSFKLVNIYLILSQKGDQNCKVIMPVCGKLEMVVFFNFILDKM
jgi:hypothetical protein